MITVAVRNMVRVGVGLRVRVMLRVRLGLGPILTLNSMK